MPWYGMGKTSVDSILNIPGRIAWFTMEIPGFLSLVYMMNTLPAEYGITDLPWQNKVLGALFVSSPPSGLHPPGFWVTYFAGHALSLPGRDVPLHPAVHVTHPPPRVGLGSLLPDHQRHPHRQLARCLRAHH